MGVRIKTISNDIQGTIKVQADSHQARQPGKAQAEAGQIDKILELEWEALGRKLHKQTDKSASVDLEKMRRQVQEKDERLKQAERKISELKKQLNALQEKQHAHRQQDVNSGQRQKKPMPVPARNAMRNQKTGGRRS